MRHLCSPSFLRLEEMGLVPRAFSTAVSAPVPPKDEEVPRRPAGDLFHGYPWVSSVT